MALVAKWACQDRAASTTVLDSGGGGFNGTLVGAGNTVASSVAGPGGAYPFALQFDGINDSVITSYTGNLGNNYGASIWVFVELGEVQTVVKNWILTKGDSWSLMFGHDNVNFEGFIQFVSAAVRDTNVTQPTGAWYHLAGTYDGTTMRLYLNGAQVDTNNTGGSVDANGNFVEIGSWFGGFNLKGRVAGAQIYNHTLTPAEILGLLGEGVPHGIRQLGRGRMGR